MNDILFVLYNLIAVIITVLLSVWLIYVNSSSEVKKHLRRKFKRSEK